MRRQSLKYPWEGLGTRARRFKSRFHRSHLLLRRCQCHSLSRFGLRPLATLQWAKIWMTQWSDPQNQMKYFKAHKNKISETTFINAFPEGIHLSSFSTFLVIFTHVVVVSSVVVFLVIIIFISFFFFFLSILLLIVVVLSLLLLVVKARFSLSLVFLQLL